LAAMYCAYGDALNVTCGGICPNADVAGIGVRIAFYSQSIANGGKLFRPIKRVTLKTCLPHHSSAGYKVSRGLGAGCLVCHRPYRYVFFFKPLLKLHQIVY
jgi:hypothetical protein